MTRYTIRELKFAILEALMKKPEKHDYKMNIIGRPFPNGDGAVENQLKTKFTNEERALAGKAFEILKNNFLISSPYNNINDPENWVKITSKGEEALKLKAFDELDILLSKINPNLKELREGAWSSILSDEPDSIRQAAHSARELIDQVIKESVSDEQIVSDTKFIKDKSSSSGITRRHRLKFIMNKESKHCSKSDLIVLEKACDLILALDDKLKGLSHSRKIPQLQEAKDSIILVEIALRILLKA